MTGFVPRYELDPDLPMARKFRTGDRVAITVGDLTAFGTIDAMAYHWDRVKGRDIYPVRLDGTGQVVEVSESRLEPEA